MLVPERGQEEDQPSSLGAAHLCALLERWMQREGSLCGSHDFENLLDPAGKMFS